MHRIAPFAGAHHSVFRWSDADAAGISASTVKRALAAGEIARLHRAVYRFTAAPETWSAQVLAACWAAPHGGHASHRTGAELYGLPGGARDPIQIRCRRWKRAHHAAIVVHETNLLAAVDRAVVDGIPVVSVERVLLDLAATSIGIAELALDDALRRRLTTVARLDGMVRRLSRQGRDGVGRLRPLVQERLAGGYRPTESVAESRVAAVLRRAGLPDPVRQHRLRTNSGAQLRSTSPTSRSES